MNISSKSREFHANSSKFFIRIKRGVDCIFDEKTFKEMNSENALNNMLITSCVQPFMHRVILITAGLACSSSWKR